jgi:LmbE family N-acetylglucosaminyl deacetylase
MSRPSHRRIALAFMAHPDDAEVLCAGTLIRLADLGWECPIATMTVGDCGTTTKTPGAISAPRTEEARQAAAVLGGRSWCLGENDGLVVYDQPTLRKAFDLFREVGPSPVFTHAPKDSMLDHEMTSLVARAASQGQRTLSPFSGKDLHQEVDTPSCHAAFHNVAFLARMLLD